MEEWKEIDFRMEIKNFSCTAFDRDQNLLNSCSEFNRSAIPRLGLKFKEKLEEEKELLLEILGESLSSWPCSTLGGKERGEWMFPGERS